MERVGAVPTSANHTAAYIDRFATFIAPFRTCPRPGWWSDEIDELFVGSPIPCRNGEKKKKSEMQVNSLEADSDLIYSYMFLTNYE